MARPVTGWVFSLLTLQFLPVHWRTAGFLMLGVLVGMGVFLTHVSRAPSYLVDDPETCINCHVMTTQYVTWQHSSHVWHATCNDCHVPHENVLREYAFKAKDGLRHATIFTMRWEPQVIRISKGAIPVVEHNCRRCHGPLVEDTALDVHAPADKLCWDCHREVPHGRVRSLSAAPEAFRPQLGPALSPFQEPTIKGRPPR